MTKWDLARAFHRLTMPKSFLHIEPAKLLQTDLEMGVFFGPQNEAITLSARTPRAMLDAMQDRRDYLACRHSLPAEVN